MLDVEQIEEWLGQEVLDSEGERIGKLEDVYYSSHRGEPVLVSVKRGMLGRRVSLAPLAGASVGRDHVRLAYTQAQIEGAGAQVDAEDTLDEQSTAQLGAVYGIDLAGQGFESASSINGRREAAREAEERALELEKKARLRGEEADDAKGNAEDASAAARQKQTEAERASAEAEQARAEAQGMSPQRPS
jgi:hypothetical protein